MAVIRFMFISSPQHIPFDSQNSKLTRLSTMIKPHQNSRISCFNSNSSNINDLELAMDLATEIEKMNTQMLQAQEAMKRSRKLLYAELCLFLGLGREELKRKWERMEEDDKWVLAEEFVSDWGSNFHPLSARSVKGLIDQHLFHDDVDDDGNCNNKEANSSQEVSSSSSILFSGLKKLMGFPYNK